MKFEATYNDEQLELLFDTDRNTVTIGDHEYSYRFEQRNGRHLLRLGSRLYKIDNVSRDRHTLEFTINGEWCRVAVRDEQDLLLDRLGFKTPDEIGEGSLNAPMPGKILEVMVDEGDTVDLGEPVAILEAMKMENELKAPIAGTISQVAVQEGDSVEKNVLILEIEASG